ncbi:MAG TPA: DUF4214 domain-containing protein [Pirellulales bacterium]
MLLTAAATITWTGGSATGSNWSDPANWDLHRAPISGDSLVFPATAQNLANTDDISGLSVNSITFQGAFAPVPGGYRIGGDDLTLGAGGISDEGTPGSTIIGVVNQINLNLNLSAAQTWSNDSKPNDLSRELLVVNGNVNNGGFELTATGNEVIDVAGAISGSGGLTVGPPASGPASTVELKNANTYTGATNVDGDGERLIVDGSTAAASALAVEVGATLGGAGTVAGPITLSLGAGPVSGGTLSPGASPDPTKDTGTLNNTAGVTFKGALGAQSEPFFAVQLDGTSASPSNDQLNSSGAVALNDASLYLTLLPGAGPFNAGQQFVIVQVGAPITSTFAGLPEGSTVSDGTQNFTISYANDRVTLTALPEVPATITWTGGSPTSSNWSDPANWNLGRAPVSGDSLVFPASAQRLANTDDIPGLNVNSITFEGTLTTNTGGYLLSGDDLNVGAGGILDNGNSNGATSTIGNQVDLNVALAAAQTWSVHSNGLHPLTVKGNVANNGFALAATGNGTIDVAGQISGSGGLTAGDPSSSLTLDLDHADTYTGGTQIDDATVTVSADGALGPGGTNDAGTAIGAFGHLLFNAVAYSTPEAIALNGGALQGGGDSSFSGPITVTGAQSGPFGAGVDGEISDLNALSTFTLNGPTLMNDGHANLLIESGPPLPQASDAMTVSTSPQIVIDNVIGGVGGLWLIHADLVLGAANTYQGPTDVDQDGTLLVDGSTAAGNTVNVAPGSTLGGSGTIGGTVVVTGGGISPGAGPDADLDTGTLTTNGDVTLQASNPPPGEQIASKLAAFSVQIGGTAAAPTSDRLNSAGSVTLDGAALNLTALPGAGPFDTGQQFVIIQAGAPITSTFIGLPEGSTVSDGVQDFTISYAGDRVTLTALPAVAVQTFTYLNGQAADNTAATFVHNLYRELLGREAGAQEQAAWVSFYDQAAATAGAAAAQQTIVNGFLSTPEYRQHLVEVIYGNFLHRAADAGGLAFWTGELAAGVDEKNVLAGVVTSNEYFIDAEGPDYPPASATLAAQDWFKALYRDMLGRNADAGGLAFWTQQTVSHDSTEGRLGVALEFFSTPEVNHKLLDAGVSVSAGAPGAPGTPAVGAYALADLTGNGWDNLYFQGRLNAAVVDSLFDQLQAGAPYGQTIAGMLAMPEYFG